jgi:hypothetical protein
MTTPDLPIAHLRRLLCGNIHLLSQSDRQEVLNYALQHLPGKKLIACGDGTRLSLDASIPDEVIRGMHALIQSKMIFYDEADFKQ